MTDEAEPLFIYCPLTHQRLLITEAQLRRDYNQFWDWKVYEFTTGNPTVEKWIDEKDKQENEND